MNFFFFFFIEFQINCQLSRRDSAGNVAGTHSAPLHFVLIRLSIYIASRLLIYPNKEFQCSESANKLNYQSLKLKRSCDRNKQERTKPNDLRVQLPCPTRPSAPRLLLKTPPPPLPSIFFILYNLYILHSTSVKAAPAHLTNRCRPIYNKSFTNFQGFEFIYSVFFSLSNGRTDRLTEWSLLAFFFSLFESRGLGQFASCLASASF